MLFRSGRPLPNAVLLGGFAALASRDGLVTLAAVVHAIDDRFAGKVAAGNKAAAAEAYDYVMREMQELEHGRQHASDHPAD